MVEKFCSRSQGQPVFGVRSAAMISRSRSISREGVIQGILIGSRRSDANLSEAKSGRDGAAKTPILVGLVRAGGLEQEPGTTLGLIDVGFQKARRGDVLVLVRDFVCLAH